MKKLYANFVATRPCQCGRVHEGQFMLSITSSQTVDICKCQLCDRAVPLTLAAFTYRTLSEDEMPIKESDTTEPRCHSEEDGEDGCTTHPSCTTCPSFR